jgi:hypothetical protein
MLKFRVGKHRCSITPSKQTRNSIFSQQQAYISCHLSSGGSFELTSNTCRVLNFKDGETKSDMTVAREMAFNIYRKLGDEASFKLKSKGKSYDIRVNCEPPQAGQFAEIRQKRTSTTAPKQISKAVYNKNQRIRMEQNLGKKKRTLKMETDSTASELFEEGSKL